MTFRRFLSPRGLLFSFLSVVIAVEPVAAQSLLDWLRGDVGESFREQSPRPPADVGRQSPRREGERPRRDREAAAAERPRGIFGDLFGDSFGDPGVAVTDPNAPVQRYGPVPSRFRRQTVTYETRERPGTIIVDTRNKFLYLVTGPNRAIRYGVGVGRDGFGWRGTVRVGRKAEWPGWTPPARMIARERRRGRILPAHMPGGPNNPLGARALYLYDGGRDTLFRIHGTNEPWTIGHNVSSGCIRLVNADVIDLYNRVPVGAKVVVR